MDANYSPHQTPQFRILSDPQIQRTIQATLECLNRTGVNVLNEEARDLLAGAGARVSGVRVRIPAHIIKDALVSAPMSFTLWGRGGKSSRMEVMPDRIHFGPGPTCTYFIDPETGERRKSRRGDPGLTARVCDALPHIDYAMGLALIDDVPAKLAPVYEYAEMVANTTKPVIPWAYSAENVSDIYQIALAVAGGEEAFRDRPSFGLFATYQSPLQHTKEDLSNVLWAVEHDIPIIYMGGGSAGSTAPITGAGSLIIYLAAVLSGLVIVQLKKRGASVCFGGIPQSTDMVTARPAYGGPETSLYSAAMADVSRYLGIPFMGTAGASEAKQLDLQAAIETTFQVLLSALSGTSLVHDAGFLDCADLGSLEMLIMTNEIIGMTQRLMRGIVISDETFMLDLIDEVGPGGEYLSTLETAHQFRVELWHPTLFDRQPWVNWEANGRKTVVERIKARLRDILANHTAPPLPENVQSDIQAILDNAEARERSKAGES
jgi:trimethylamine--corrinoid protein Co-methyltransferase